MTGFQTLMTFWTGAMTVVWPWIIKDVPAMVGRARARGGVDALARIMVVFGVAGTGSGAIVLLSGVATSTLPAVWIGGALTIANAVLGGIGWTRFKNVVSA